MKSHIHYFLVFLIIVSCTGKKKEVRETIDLNGIWEVEESATIKLPENYTHTCIVPGLVDMATPSFDSVGVKYTKRNFYNYHRTFNLPQDLPSVVLLKVYKATYGTRVLINGQEAGYNPFCFTPGLFDIRKFLKPGITNDITLQLGAYIDNIPDSIPDGHDFEKVKYLAGVYDNVEIILSGYPFINNFQVVPDIKNNQIKVVSEIESDRDKSGFSLNYIVNEDKSGRLAGKGVISAQQLKKGVNKIEFTLSINNCKLWSPESPFLYKLNLSTGKDSKAERFGLRSFRCDKDTKMAILNDKPYPMLGTNVCIFRFFEDPTRDSLPWNYIWVKKLHQKFKDMNWNSIRYCIGFPPEQWYEIADETGFLIQDEYPLWGTTDISTSSLKTEYTRWMRERWNHPCVVIWDAQNETITNKTGEALSAVRGLDLSNRPWDNGYAAPQSETDCIESHPYLFVEYQNWWTNKPRPEPKVGYMKDFFDTIRLPNNDPNEHSPSKNGRYNNPVVINEYDWLWINRDGSPTTLTDKVYSLLFKCDTCTTDEIRFIHAENVGILTEYWRCNRTAAAVMHFCGLGYSRTSQPRGQTSDNFTDIKNLEFDPWFYSIVKNKFAPLCIMINKWDKSYISGELNVPVYVINDLPDKWKGNVTLSIRNKKHVITGYSEIIDIESSGRTIRNFKVNIPGESGDYEMVSELAYKNDTIRSVRKFKIK
jgi:beta-galactosidase